MKFGALAFILFVPQKFAIQLQLLGGVWMLQTFPAIAIGLYSRWFHRHALLAGWLVGMLSGTWMCKTLAFKSTTYALHVGGLTIPGYAALWAVILNLIVAAAATLALNSMNVDAGADATSAEDFV